VASLAHRKQFGSQELDRILITLTDRAVQFFNLFAAPDGRSGFRAHEAFLEKNEEAYRDVLRALELVTLQLELLKAPPDEAIPLVTRARELARRLEFWMEGPKGKLDKRYVYWIERRGRRTFLQATPIEVSQLLDERLFERRIGPASTGGRAGDPILRSWVRSDRMGRIGA